MSDVLSLLRDLLPNGKLHGREYRVGSINGESGDSLSFNIDTQLWSDFNNPKHSGKGFDSLYKKIKGTVFSGDVNKPLTTKVTLNLLPVEIDEEITGQVSYYSPKTNKFHTCKPTLITRYAEGYVLRQDKLKALPLRRMKTKDDKIIWVTTWWETKTLFDLAGIEKSTHIIICEGEKSLHALKKKLPDACVTTWPSGASAIEKVNLLPLQGKKIYLWPDADLPGHKAMQHIADNADAAEIHMVDITGYSDGWDAADLIAEGGDPADFIKNKSKKIQREITVNDDPYAWVNTIQWVTGKEVVYFGQYPVIMNSRSMTNAAHVILNWHGMQKAFVYDLFQDDIHIIKQPPWHKKGVFDAHPVRDKDYIAIRMWLETIGIRVSKNDVQDMVIHVAHENTVNPPKDYFEGLEWDGEPRLNRWLSYYLGCEQQPAQYLGAVGTKWLVGAVSRVYKPGAKFDTALFLEGAQGIGKSRTLEELATFNGKRYFTDESIDFKSKDSVMVLQGKIIAELAELVSFRKADTDEIKAFITRRVDMYRPPYGRNIQERPRMFVLSGSTNPDGGGEYFSDRTGNRRYWPVLCNNTKIDVESLSKEKYQLWAEAVHLYKSGYATWLNDEEDLLAKDEQEQRLIEDTLQSDIQKTVNKLAGLMNTSFTVNEIFDELKIPSERKSTMLGNRIKSVLRGMGYIEIRRKEGVTTIRKWKMETLGGGNYHYKTTSDELDESEVVL